MASYPNIPNGNGEQASEPVLQTETQGARGGRKAKTALGAADMGGEGGSAWPGNDQADQDPGRKVLYSHLKDMAIDALELSKIKDQQAISQSIGYVIGSFEMQPEIADVLASMVVAAYSCAQEIGDEKAVYLAYSCFSDSQLARIIKLAGTR